MASNFFDERSGIVPCNTKWGRWWQTVDEVHIEIKMTERVRRKYIDVVFTNQSISVSILDTVLFSGNLFRKVHGDECLWLLEDDGKLLKIVLNKADFVNKEIVWESLLEDGSFKADPITYIEMKKKIDLEKFQIEYPGMDFSKAQLQKNYDTAPGL